MLSALILGIALIAAQASALSENAQIIATKVARYQNLAAKIKAVIEPGQPLTPEARDLISVTFNHLTEEKRALLQVFSVLDGGSSQLHVVNRIKLARLDMAENLVALCTEVLSLIDEYLLQASPGSELETRLFYYNMRGDNWRYLADVQQYREKPEEWVREQRRNADSEAAKAYLQAVDLAEILEPTHPLKLNVALSYSSYLYKRDRSTAIELAKKALDAAESEAANLSKEAEEVVQMLRDRVASWEKIDISHN